MLWYRINYEMHIVPFSVIKKKAISNALPLGGSVVLFLYMKSIICSGCFQETIVVI